MSIALTEKERLTSWASWHEDREINERQARKLAADVLATRERLLEDCMRALLNYVPSVEDCAEHLSAYTEGLFTWICWRGKAIAVFTKPKSHVKDCRYYLTWHWKSLGAEKN